MSFGANSLPSLSLPDTEINLMLSAAVILSETVTFAVTESFEFAADGLYTYSVTVLGASLSNNAPRIETVPTLPFDAV